MRAAAAGALACLALQIALASPGLAQTSGANSAANVFTMAKYPVDASATNAVAAKKEALATGQRAAFRSLLKRLVPAASYGLIGQLKRMDPERFISGVRIRSERNSSTQYIASLDFAFEPGAVRTLLQEHRVPFVEQAAAPSHMLLFYSAPASGGSTAMAAGAGGQTWERVWADLDLGNSLAPLQLIKAAPGELTPETQKSLLLGDPATLQTLGAQYRTTQIVACEARPLPASSELEVTLAGQDGAGRFSVTTRYRLDAQDLAYSMELAAVIAQGVLEGRWKTVQLGGGPQAAGTSLGGSSGALQIMAEFNNLEQWQRQQQVLASIPGLRNMQIGSLSGRSASIELSYPGGGEALQAALSPQGLTLENINGFWILR